ncbi:fused response regulator/phosphatase [Leptolyngbya sp. 'hensonii']|uniref:SpoIIE family protein phosphatase n=1 Tax=Leptolyngbya sp. 'hensonii' TaxID=1922337 RepID=UPI00094FC5DD|nr:SpoIIE family protein phosphatase [Leptolyngbya sp. 'hensonii']OLP17269.1 fused response regulator/phosphatase [Leptolyngbya sp. 'hensonii']
MSQGNGGKLRLMVVDDEPDNLDLLYRTFRREFTVFKAVSGHNALQTLDQEGEMAIIISDQRMPGMNGTEFLSRTVDRFPDTIRIVLTGYTDVEDLVGAINTGKVFKYITKPWMPDDLKAVVNQAADTYKVLKQRTNELNRALRRESILNAVTTAIRESLDYHSMLQTIIETLGRTFEASSGILRPLEGSHLTSEVFSYQAQVGPGVELAIGQSSIPSFEQDEAVQAALETWKTQVVDASQNPDPQAEAVSEKPIQLVVPLTYQQSFLAVLSLYRSPGTQSWKSEDIELIEGVAEQAALAISQAKLYQQIQQQTQQMRAELEVARQIQTNLLRQSWPDLEGIKVQASCIPAREVGGDFFEVFVHPQGDIWVTVGDVSGKGVPAALFMASLISVLRRELSQEVPPEPDVVMYNLNGSLSDDLISNNRFITMVLARYTPTTQQLAYANAGHVYPMVWSHRTLTSQVANQESISIEPNYLKTRGIPLGIRPAWKGTGDKIALNSGDVFLLTSDGITEATVPSDHAGNGQITSAMLQQAGLWQLLKQEPSPLLLANILTKIQAHNQVQEDDQTILSLEVL